ncbi:hypothetical protein M409DRAFT_68993 [Zasmidium cellare ATCC 36951]|uniref:Uncharacterized protein n=1 Tax=Zasmidium cellare ATCC 36951 TaxID=1080233 RepID=A0A6A6C914_ZASCE|nr:uncharacterized protein M409DRAFT_68993 [Zasmidium cellare ATCC 36951]KAF2162730.1 hypothetical protein M409DRAFT_68993 [Zasmidium cellare ATCC 36951]
MRSSAILPLLSSAAVASPAGWQPGWGGNKQPSWGWGSWGGGWGWGKPHGPPPYSPSTSVAYFLYNDPAGASIVSLEIGQDGKLVDDPVKTATGGVGSLQVNASGSPAMSDTLGSQGSVTIKDNLLFTVNAGSDTLSLFFIDPQSPTKPKLVGSPINTLGNFPISVDYSPQLRKACVLNGGAKAGVACFSVDPFHGLQADGPLRALGSSIINETTPPSGPPGSAAQVLFNPDSSAVFATVKGNPDTKKLGSMAVWPVDNGDISQGEPVVSTFDGLYVDFGFLFVSQSEIFLSDAGSGAALVTVGDGWKVTLKEHTVIPGQQATCWTAYVPSLNTLYAIDAGYDGVYTLDPATGKQTGTINVQIPGGNATMGVFDSFVKNETLYSLVGSNGLVVVDLKTEQQVQYLDLSSFGSRQYYQGLAQWP